MRPDGCQLSCVLLTTRSVHPVTFLSLKMIRSCSLMPRLDSIRIWWWGMAIVWFTLVLVHLIGEIPWASTFTSLHADWDVTSVWMWQPQEIVKEIGLLINNAPSPDLALVSKFFPCLFYLCSLRSTNCLWISCWIDGGEFDQFPFFLKLISTPSHSFIPLNAKGRPPKYPRMLGVMTRMFHLFLIRSEDSYLPFSKFNQW